MATIWLSSDLHLGHANILTFTDNEGQRIRPQFSNLDEMHDYIITQHNSVVRPGDHWYCVGDIAMNKTGLQLVKALNGRKRIVLGNHDADLPIKALLDAGFEKVFGCRKLSNLLLTHVPIHPSNFGRFDGNIHGHIHQNPSPEGPYLNVSVEALQAYTPITLEASEAIIRRKREMWKEPKQPSLARLMNMDKMAKYEGLGS